MMSVLAALLLVTASAAGAPPADPDGFRTEMLGRIHAALPALELTAKADEPLVIRAKGGEWEDAEFNLHRIYAYCRDSSEAECETAKAEFVRKLAKPVATPQPATLRLIVRDAEYLSYVRNQETKREVGRIAIYEPIGEDLYAILASDSPEQIALVGDATLKTLGLTQAEAWERARRETATKLPALPTAAQLRSSGVGYEADEYLASLLIDLGRWAEIAREVGPDLFITVVSDQFVLVGTIPDGPGLDRFKKTVADDCAAQQRCISPHIYRFRSGRWVIAP